MTQRQRARRPATHPATDAAPAGPRLLQRLLPWLVGALAVVAFGRTVGYDFVRWDDDLLIVDNPLFLPDARNALATIWSGPNLGYYIPLTFTAWGAIHRLAGPDPRVFHAVNVVGHAFNTVLVYLVVLDVLRARSRHLARVSATEDGRRRRGPPIVGLHASLLAAAGAALFAVHPLQVEAVAWATGLKDLLPTLFSLLAVHAYFRAGERTASAAPGGHRLEQLAGYRPLAALLFLAALVSKPSVVTLGPALLVLDVGVCRAPWREALRGTAAWFVLAVPFALVTQREQPATLLDMVAPLWLRPFVALDAVAFYLGKLVAPVGLTIDYGRTPQWLLETGSWRWTFAIPSLAAAAAAFAAWRGRWAPISLLLAFVVTLAPVLGLVPFWFQQHSTVADHYMYFALTWAALGTALLLAELPVRRGVAIPAAVAVCAVLAVLAVLTLRHTPIWTGNDALFPHAIARNPRGTMLRMNYGVSLYLRQRYEESLEQFHAAVAVRPHADLYSNIAGAHFALQRYVEAEEAFVRALELNPAAEEYRRRLEIVRQVRGSQGDAP